MVEVVAYDHGTITPMLSTVIEDDVDNAFKHVLHALKQPDPITALKHYPREYVQDVGEALLTDPDRARDRAGEKP